MNAMQRHNKHTNKTDVMVKCLQRDLTTKKENEIKHAHGVIDSDAAAGTCAAKEQKR